MPPPAYTKRLGQVTGPAAGTYLFGPPPTGYIWDLRDIVAWCAGDTAGEGISGFSVGFEDGTVVFAVPAFDAISLRSYHWHGRQVLDGQNGHIITQRAGWYVSVTGYELSIS